MQYPQHFLISSLTVNFNNTNVQFNDEKHKITA